MIPANNDNLQTNFQFDELPTSTFYLNTSKNIISGFTDGLQAMTQLIYLILNVERYEYPIYSLDYGIELADLFGQPIAFCIPEIKRRITEALMQDSRITGVGDFDFEHRRGKVFATFIVHTIFGDIDAERVVEI